MNASRRIARKHLVRSVTEMKARKEMAGTSSKTLKRRLNSLLDTVHMFLCNAAPRQIAAQARKLGIFYGQGATVNNTPSAYSYRRRR